MREQLSAPAAGAAKPSPRPARVARLLRGLPTLLVLAALGGVAWWGHRTGWDVAAAWGARKHAAAADDWCGAHGVPESVCVECNPGLVPKPPEYGWCPEHGVHNCPLEHPDVAQLKDRPDVPPADLERARRALALAERPENSSRCTMYQRRVQFASQAAFDRTGVEVEPVWRAPVTEAVTANGEVAYDQTRIARLSARVPGTMWRVEKQVGDPVQAGEVVALVEAPEIGRAKAEFLQAVTQLRLKRETLRALNQVVGSIPEQRLREATAALSEAQIRLLTAQQALVNHGLAVDAEDLQGLSDVQLAAHMQFLGLSDALRKSLDPKTTTANLLPVKAPLAGVVVAREVVAGEAVNAAKVLFVVADLRQMWLTLSVRQEDAGKLRLGQPVRFRANVGDERAAGAIAWISPFVDERTRTVQVRADLANADGRLRAFTFGKGQVVLREEKDAIVVPNDAVHWEGDCFVVFVRDKDFLAEDGPKVFHTRTVRLGARQEKVAEIVAGVLPGEVVATRGSGLLRAELLKNNLGES